MKTSIIRHPERSYFLRRHDWQIKALESLDVAAAGERRLDVPHCGAEILSVLEFHYNNRLANRLLREQLANAQSRTGGKILDTGEWQPYSEKYWKELLLGGRGRDVISKSIVALNQIGFISLEVPADIQEFYHKQLTWIRLDVDKINTWIDENIQKSWASDWTGEDTKGMFTRKLVRFKASGDDPETELEQVTEPPKPETKEAKNFGKMVTAICAFYKHIHNKNKAFVIDSNRRGKVEARMREPNRTPGMAAQAILGNLKSAHHQGINDQHKVYDDIELIFRSARHFENHIGYALEAKITEEIALAELEAFLEGGVSKYAKRQPKTPQNASKRKVEASLPEVVRPDVEQARYRSFARDVAAFFANGVENQAIMEICKENAGLREKGAGLVDAKYLDESIRHAIAIFKPNGLEPLLIGQIEAFADVFCKLETLKTEVKE